MYIEHQRHTYVGTFIQLCPGHVSCNFQFAGSNALEKNKFDDLIFQLENNEREIIKNYSHYVTKVRESLVATPVKKIYQKLLTLPTYSSCGNIASRLPDKVIAKLYLAETSDEIVNILVTDWASYINYDIFELLLDEFCPNRDPEDFNYPNQFDSYIRKHNVAEFVSINPTLEKFTEESSILTVKLDLAHKTKLSKVVDIKYCISRMLGMLPSALRIIGIREGCVELILGIPARAANNIFHRNATFLLQQQQFKNLSVMWLECNGLIFDFRGDCLSIVTSLPVSCIDA